MTPVQKSGLFLVCLVDEDGASYRVGVDKCKIKELDLADDHLIPIVRGELQFHLAGFPNCERIEDASSEFLDLVWG